MTKEEFERTIRNTSLKVGPYYADEKILSLIRDLDIRLRKIEDKEP